MGYTAGDRHKPTRDDIRAYDAAGYAYDDDSEQCITEKRIL